MLAVGAVGTALGFIVMSQVQALWMVYAGAILIGLFQALIVVPNVQILNEWMPEGAGIAMGFVMGATGAGGIIMAQIMPRIVESVSWRAGYGVCAVMFLVLTIIGLLLAGGKSPYVLAEEKNGDGKKGKNFGMVAKDPMFWIFIAMCFLGNGVQNIDQHLAPIMTTKGFTTGMIANTMTLFNVTLLIWKISQGAMYKKFTGKRFIVVYSILGTLGFLGMAWDVPLFYFGIVMKSFVGAGITVCYSLICNEYFGTKFGGAVWGFAWAAFQFGATIFSPIYGSFLDRDGTYDNSVWIGAIATLIIGAVFFYLLNTKDKRAQKEAAKSA